MAERPLLLFPTPTVSKRDPGPGGGSTPTIPSHKRLIERQRPKFASLVHSFRKGLFNISYSTAGLEPEQVLIIEINGRIDNFLRLCENTEGIDFLADIDIDEIEDDPDYPDAKNGKLILSMTNSTGLRNLLTLWNQFKKDGQVNFPRGMAQWKNIFNQLNDIRLWGIKERLEETYALENWQFEIEENGKEEVQTEVELFYQRDSGKRRKIEEEVSKICEDIGGNVIKSLVINDIRYHGLLISIPKQSVEEILDEKELKLIRFNYIMHFRPVGQSVPTHSDSEFLGDFDDKIIPHELKDSRLAILDGLPIQNHEAIKSHLNIVDPDNFEKNYPAEYRKHGTAMTSLVINGCLEDEEDNFIPSSSIYVRPILKYDADKESELIPENEFFIDLIHRAVVDIKDQQSNELTKQPTVQVINLSVADPFRLFHWELSSIAKLLDWLSWKYNVLFIVSAGNHTDSLNIDKLVDGIDLKEQFIEKKREVLFKRIHEIQRFRRLMAPAEAINAITVGASHDDNTDVPNQLIDLIGDSNLPASFNPITFGFRKSVKPEILKKGGKSVFRLHPNGNNHYKADLFTNIQKPGLKTGYPSPRNVTTGFAYLNGTSFAAALTSRDSLRIIEMLDELNSNEQINIAESYYPVVIKTLLTHSTAWENSIKQLEVILKNDENSRYFKKIAQKYFGYGVSNIERSLQCIENRATIIGVGTLNKEEAHSFSVPIPECFNDVRVLRRLIFTLSWISPINTEHSNYRRAHLTLDITGSENFVKNSNKEVHAKNVVKGTVEHRIEQSKSKVHLTGSEAIDLKVTCREDAGFLDDPIRYSIAVTIEHIATNDLTLPVYNQVKERITTRVRQQI